MVTLDDLLNMEEEMFYIKCSIRDQYSIFTKYSDSPEAKVLAQKIKTAYETLDKAHLHLKAYIMAEHERSKQK